uniref:Uncharacterized protein n=1 Tax=Tetranychus urticae TaxID=32264 RepID=T1KV92_TETUR
MCSRQKTEKNFEVSERKLSLCDTCPSKPSTCLNCVNLRPGSAMQSQVVTLVALLGPPQRSRGQVYWEGRSRPIPVIVILNIECPKTRLTIFLKDREDGKLFTNK